MSWRRTRAAAAPRTRLPPPARRAAPAAAPRAGPRRRRSAAARSRLRGTRRTRLSSYHAPHVQPSSVEGQTAVRFAASPHSTIASSCVSGTRGSPSRRRRIAVPTAKGRFATTANGSLGSGTSVASPSTTSTRGSPPNRVSSCRSAAGSSSTARTRAPASASARVSAPPPAPRSSTSVPGRIRASRTSSSAKARLRRAWRPRGRACGEARPATEESHRRSLRR